MLISKCFVVNSVGQNTLWLLSLAFYRVFGHGYNAAKLFFSGPNKASLFLSFQ